MTESGPEVSEVPKRHLTRDGARAAALYTVDLDGILFDGRVPAALELLAAGIMPFPTTTPASTPEEQAKEGARIAAVVNERVMRVGDYQRAFLSLALTRPALWTGAPEACPPEQVTYETLGPYLDGLVPGILVHMGYEEERRKALEFRRGVGTGGAAPAPGGDDWGLGSAAAPVAG